MPNNQSRRNALKNLMAGTAAIGTASMLSSFSSPDDSKTTLLKGNINHSVCRWCYNTVPLEEFCAAVSKMGIKAVDLVGPKDWEMLKKYNLDSSMCNGAEINLEDGFNDPKFHDQLIQRYSDMIPQVAKAGYTNLICFSGNRRGKDDETGLKNSAEGLKKLTALAEKNKVVLVMELLNSKVNHKDYQCDKSAWGIELVKRVGSPNFKLLYDIYHMQIDEGDVISTIKTGHQYFAHYHTGGVPGRHEIDDTQELYYPAIMNAIVKTGFKGYVAQEFIPDRKTNEDRLASLQKAITICDV
ncbi:MAG: hydroxypyruvate isomerase [Chitinophagaceae bacterium]|nr:MAG: hydroxypyruvate isomerase [Chitinophagaceae bacterium]